MLQKVSSRKIFAIGSSHFSLMRQSYPNIKSLTEADYKVFSQTGEDGIIDYLLYSLDIKTPRFVEIGVGDYRESNTRFLYERASCKGLIIDVIKDLEKRVIDQYKKSREED